MEKTAPIINKSTLITIETSNEKYHTDNSTPRFGVKNWIKSATIMYFIVIIFDAHIHIVHAECPRLCECKWKNGKETVLCLTANLTSLPPRLDAGTQVLDLTGNEIATINRDTFLNANLLNLQKVFIAKCRLKTIDQYAFRKLINLVELDMSYNILSKIPSHALESISELRELKLIGNPIQYIENDAFIHVPQLVRLELSDCRITEIEYRGFSGLESTLEWLKIDGNRLSNVRAATITTLQNLHGLELAGNPWNCSCEIRPLREWMLRENIPCGVPPICKLPQRLTTKSWDKIELDDFACVPKILAPDILTQGVEGKNVTMSCTVTGVPEPNVQWILRNRVIANLSGNTYSPSAQGRRMYVAHLQHNASRLTILTAEVQDAGIYTCSAENKAGKVEASVTLAVTRKPPEDRLTTKVLIASIIVAALFVIASTLAVVCVCTLRKRRKLLRWNTHHPSRSESYEKIEMNNKPNHQMSYDRCDPTHGYVKSPKIDVSSFGGRRSNSGETTAVKSVVDTGRRNGEYLNVPSEDDDGTEYEDNLESNTTTLSNIIHRDNNGSMKWSHNFKDSLDGKSGIIDKSDIIFGPPDRNANLKPDDLHIPRLIEFSDIKSESCLQSSSELVHTNPAGIVGYVKPNWSESMAGLKKGSSPKLIQSESMSSAKLHFSDMNRRIEDDRNVDETGEKKYPDLLEISNFSNNNQKTLINSAATSGMNTLGSNSNSFCTLPRKQFGIATTNSNNLINSRNLRAVSESQSPLLPADSSSRYGSSTTFVDSINDNILSSRRLSIDSYSNYPLSAINKSNGKSNSFLNLLSPLTPNDNSGNINVKMIHRRNPSLPSSPIKDSKSQRSHTFSPAATPLLDFSTLPARNTIISMGSVCQQPATLQHTQPSAKTKMTQSSTSTAYDYHAAQLERFLEEYRNLQEQLCKMKETCDSIRKKEQPQSLRVSNIGQSAKFADPVMYTAAALGSVTGTSIHDDITGKNLLSHSGSKGKSKMLPGQPPDPPPYWLHRNAMLKRLQDNRDPTVGDVAGSQNDFFQS